MGKIVISETASLDGVIQDPTGEEGFRFGGWFDPAKADREAWAKVLIAEALGTEALLLGRRSYEYFVARGWVSRSGEWADRLRSLPKYVVSSAIENLEWQNSTVLKGDVVDEVSKLKRKVNGDIVVYASGRLVPTLMEHDLVDELRLIVYPAVAGAGERLFGETGDRKIMHLIGARTVGDSLVSLTYQPVREA
ncbi:dihydrofolate reductase family protein [Microbispora sp. NPDC049125]|uniref:dihydrofolate reductase family protein n=1 Tax=Microbispora sp. NPDC049125 TaxID=3154929 RepID=UPI0034675A0F